MRITSFTSKLTKKQDATMWTNDLESVLRPDSGLAEQDDSQECTFLQLAVAVAGGAFGGAATTVAVLFGLAYKRMRAKTAVLAVKATAPAPPVEEDSPV